MIVVPEDISYGILDAINEENRYGVFDVMLVGDLRPDRKLMSKGVVMATNSGRDVY